MIFVVHEPMGFEQKWSPILSFMSRNCFANMLNITKTVVHRTLCFAMEIVAEPFGFKEKLCFKHVISVQNRRMRRPFLSKREVFGAMHLSGTSQAHDLAKVDDFETLSL